MGLVEDEKENESIVDLFQVYCNLCANAACETCRMR